MNNCSIAKGDDLKYAALRLQSLFIIHYSLFIIHYSSFIIHFPAGCGGTGGWPMAIPYIGVE